MTNEELAKHWGVSLEKAQRISDTINQNFHLGIVKVAKGFQCVMYQMNVSPSGQKRVYEYFRIPVFCKSTAQAIFVSNTLLDAGFIKLPTMFVEVMGVPQDAFVALKRLSMPFTQPVKGKDAQNG